MQAITGVSLSSDGGVSSSVVCNQSCNGEVPSLASHVKGCTFLRTLPLEHDVPSSSLISFCSNPTPQADSKTVSTHHFYSSFPQIAVDAGHLVFAFTRPGDTSAQQFALDLGAQWAGGSNDTPPETLDAAIIFAPVGSLIPVALRAVKKGGTVVAGGIHMSDVPSFPYSILWGEQAVVSVANLTRVDGWAFLDLAPKVPVDIRTTVISLDQANEALAALRGGRLDGVAVLVP
jgi:hypothetical protein